MSKLITLKKKQNIKKLLEPAKSNKPITRLCSVFERQQEELNKLSTELVQALVKQSKVKWSWGIVQSTNILLKCPKFKRRDTICRGCRNFAESRKNLADLVIVGSRT